MAEVVDIAPYLKGEKIPRKPSVSTVEPEKPCMTVEEMQFMIKIIEVVDTRGAFRYEEAENVRAFYFRLNEIAKAHS
jgi:hypothetical protein